MHYRVLKLTIALAAPAFGAGLARPMAAQQPGPITAFGDSTVVDVTVAPPQPAVQTVYLRRRVVYRASFSRAGVVLTMRAADRRRLPFVTSNEGTAGPGASMTYEIYPAVDGPIDLKAEFISGDGPARFLLWTDAQETGLGSHAGKGGFWEYGMEFQIAPHPKYTRLGGVVADPGITYGLCLAMRNGPSPAGVVNGCLAGVEHITGATGSQLWGFFTEPRLRLLGRHRPRTGWATDGGLDGRLEYIDDPSGGQSTGSALGMGVYLARDLQITGEGPGWRWTAAGRMDWTSLARRWFPVVQVGIGRYW